MLSEKLNYYIYAHLMHSTLSHCRGYPSAKRFVYFKTFKPMQSGHNEETARLVHEEDEVEKVEIFNDP